MRQYLSDIDPQHRGKPRPGAALLMLAAVALNTAAVQAKAPIVDGDGDGVDDAVDQCLYTPPHAVVDARGCSAQSDQDGDGVADSADDCPYTPAGAEVDAHGCALDDDFDGIADGLDACPGTELGAVVDTQGCSSGQVAKAIKPRPRAAAIPPAAAITAVPTPPVVTPAASQTTPMPVTAVAQPPSAAVMPSPSPAAAAARAPVRIVIPAPAPPSAIAAMPTVASGPVTATANPASLLSLSFGAQTNNIGPAAMARIDKALPTLRSALAAQKRAVLLVEGYADTESDGDAADTMARSRANMLRRVLEQKGIDGKRLRSVGHHAVDAGSQFRRADVVLEAE